uniref:Secreted protein n=1 Tax=Anopheles coluzzii TaxID=1518534 RepID=A0A8W7PAB4_ANOCL
MVMLVVMVVVMLGRHHRAAGGHDRGVADDAVDGEVVDEVSGWEEQRDCSLDSLRTRSAWLSCVSIAVMSVFSRSICDSTRAFSRCSSDISASSDSRSSPAPDDPPAPPLSPLPTPAVPSLPTRCSPCCCCCCCAFGSCIRVPDRRWERDIEELGDSAPCDDPIAPFGRLFAVLPPLRVS